MNAAGQTSHPRGGRAAGASARTRLGLRGSLTVLYGALCLAVGAVILSLLFVVVRDRLDQELGSQAADDRIAALRQQAVRSGEAVVTTPDGSSIAIADLAAQIRQDREDIKDAALDSLLVQGSVVVLATTLLAGAAGWVIAGRGLRPLHTITATAEGIARARGPERDLSRRIALAGRHDDVKRLADSFDEMLAALEESLSAQRRFVANASHELRTPLAVARTLIELETTRPGVPEQTVRLGRSLLDLNTEQTELIERLLLLAESEQPVEHPVDVDLAAVVRETVETVVATTGTTVDVRTDLRPATTTGDPILLAQLVRNLVENAVAHNSPDGWATITTTLAEDGAGAGSGSATARLRVVNTGPVISPDDVPGLFEPFRRHRADRTRSDGGGFGIGLAIVKAVTDAHHGAIVAQPRTDGGGLDVSVDLPARPR